MRAFLTTNIEDASLGHSQDGLQHKGAFADAGFAAQEDDGAGNESTAEHAIQLLVV